MRNDPAGWVVVSEQSHRFDGIDFVASAPEQVEAVCVSFFHNGLFENSEHGRMRRFFELLVYNADQTLSEEQDLPLEQPEFRIPAAMALVQRITGISPERFWFTGPFPYVWAADA